MVEKKELLSYEEIQLIVAEAARPHFKDPRIIVFSRKRTDVIRVSTINQLIFIEGDVNTGFAHINQRHSQYHEKPHWRKTKGKDGTNYWQLQTHSFFSNSVTPYFDYPNIADSIYKNENLNIEENTNPENYDLYSGTYQSPKDGTIPFKLVLYKGTKIVHNLYPNTNIFTPERVLNYKKGSLSATYSAKNCLATIRIPYRDRKKLIKYRIVFLQDYFHKREKILIERLNYDSKSLEIFFITERVLPYKEFNQFILARMDFIELPGLEKIILSIEKIK